MWRKLHILALQGWFFDDTLAEEIGHGERKDRPCQGKVVVQES